MREPKFKAFCKESKKMFFPSCIDFEFKKVWVFKEDGEMCDLSFEFHQIELLEYTGRKDKNKKEIYEGDIVKNEDGKVGEIVYWAPEFFIVPTHALHPHQTICFGNEPVYTLRKSEYCEIIGNIYEDGELLNENN